MMKINKNRIFLSCVIIILPMIMGVILWKQLPEQLPTHFGLNNQVDRYSSRTFTIFGLPLFLLAIQLFTIFKTITDPKKSNINQQLFAILIWIIPIISLVVYTITYSTALGYPIDIRLIITLFLGSLFIVLGNYLPKTKPNYSIGFKLSWTLNNSENWRKTHRFAGKIWVAMGILIILTSFLPIYWLMFVFLGIAVIVPSIYSYILYIQGN